MSRQKPNDSGKRRHFKRRTVVISIGVCVTVILSGVVWAFFRPGISSADTEPISTVVVQKGTLSLGTSADGTSALSTRSQYPNGILDSSGLEIEEVHVAAGDTVEVGTTLLTVTADSLNQARTELTTAVTDATNALAKAAIEHDSAGITAKSEREANLALATTAKQDYNNSLQNLVDRVESAQEKLADAQEIIANNPALITTLASEIITAETTLTTVGQNLSQAQTEVASQQETFAQIERAYNIAKATNDTVRSVCEYAQQYAQNKGGMSVLGSDYQLFANAAETELKEKSAALADLETPYKTAKSALEQAQAKVRTGDSAVKTATQNLAALKQDLADLEDALEQAQGNLATLQLAYKKAVADQQTGQITAEQTYQEKLLICENAETTYTLTVQNLDETLTQAEQAKIDAEANLALFEAAIGDGTLEAAYAGQIGSVGYEAEDVLTAAGAVATYYNSEVVTVAVSIDQADIAGIAVGDDVTVSFTTVGSQPYTGKVITIDRTSSSTSVSDVNYTVTVQVEGDVAALSSGLTAEVSFTGEVLTDILFVAESAIRIGSSGTYVQKQVDGTGVETPVTTGQSNGIFIAVEEGLDEGDICIIPQSDT